MLVEMKSKPVTDMGVAIYFRAKRLSAWLKTWVAPKAMDQDLRRKELVLSIILGCSFILLTFLFATIIWNVERQGDGYGGIGITYFSLLLVFVLGLFALLRKGYLRFASYGIVALFFVGSFYSGYQWGASLPATLLSFTLVMIIAELLLGSRAGLAVAAASFLALGYLSFHEANMSEVINWKNDPITMTDIISYLAIIAFILVLSWISNRQTEKSLGRAQASERDLQLERDNLETKVIERTKELRQTQEERVAELSHIAEFGRMSQGLFHDLMAPITAMLANVERMSSIPRAEIAEAKESLERVATAGKRFGRHLSSVRMAISRDKGYQSCSFEEELGHVLDLLAYHARERSVTFRRPTDAIGSIPFEPIRIYRIILNLVSNAIESFEKSAGQDERVISISARRENNEFKMKIRDNGSGISPENLAKVFEPFFSTKTSGSGIGLSEVKRLVEQAHGHISLESKIGKGTSAKVHLPL